MTRAFDLSPKLDSAAECCAGKSSLSSHSNSLDFATSAAAFMPALCRSCVACFSAAAAFFSAGVSTCFSAFAGFFSFSFFLGGSLMPESFRRISLPRSSGVFPARPTVQLNRENILHDLVRISGRGACHQGFEFGAPTIRQRLADRAPLVQECLQLGDCRGVIGFGKKVCHILHRDFLNVAIGLDGSFGFLSRKIFLNFLRLLREFLDGLDLGGAVAPAWKECCRFLAIASGGPGWPAASAWPGAAGIPPCRDRRGP